MICEHEENETEMYGALFYLQNCSTCFNFAEKEPHFLSLLQINTGTNWNKVYLQPKKWNSLPKIWKSQRKIEHSSSS